METKSNFLDATLPDLIWAEKPALPSQETTLEIASASLVDLVDKLQSLNAWAIAGFTPTEKPTARFAQAKAASTEIGMWASASWTDGSESAESACKKLWDGHSVVWSKLLAPIEKVNRAACRKLQLAWLLARPMPFQATGYSKIFADIYRNTDPDDSAEFCGAESVVGLRVAYIDRAFRFMELGVNGQSSRNGDYWRPRVVGPVAAADLPKRYDLLEVFDFLVQHMDQVVCSKWHVNPGPSPVQIGPAVVRPVLADRMLVLTGQYATGDAIPHHGLLAKIMARHPQLSATSPHAELASHLSVRTISAGNRFSEDFEEPLKAWWCDLVSSGAVTSESIHELIVENLTVAKAAKCPVTGADRVWISGDLWPESESVKGDHRRLVRIADDAERAFHICLSPAAKAAPSGNGKHRSGRRAKQAS